MYHGVAMRAGWRLLLAASLVVLSSRCCRSVPLTRGTEHVIVLLVEESVSLQ
jgi:hypothetical protein